MCLLYCVSQPSVMTYRPIINADGDGDLAEDEVVTGLFLTGGRSVKVRATIRSLEISRG